MSDSPPPPDPVILLQSIGRRAKKSWGQNFLRDQNVLAQIAQASGAAPEVSVIELGAGLGALTYHLLRLGAAVVAVERDRDLVPLLRQALAWSPALEIIEADAAGLHYAALAKVKGSALHVAGNLPYQLSSRLLVNLADAVPHIGHAVVMVQKEVATRLVAQPGGRDYGLLSVLVQRAFNAKILRHVKASAFLPPPRVDSTVVVLTAHCRKPEGSQDALLVRVARAAFSQRRKRLDNALAHGLGVAKAEVHRLVVAAGLDPGCRAETLGLEEFTHLATAFAELLLSADCG
ncbi:MAG: 16S rRNA (adenine(1518)-N(6)/adenine(1519)-N(6))-dimethyltransferase RsmA [Myxococcota bacterium]